MRIPRFTVVLEVEADDLSAAEATAQRLADAGDGIVVMVCAMPPGSPGFRRADPEQPFKPLPSAYEGALDGSDAAAGIYGERPRMAEKDSWGRLGAALDDLEASTEVARKAAEGWLRATARWRSSLDKPQGPQD